MTDFGTWPIGIEALVCMNDECACSIEESMITDDTTVTTSDGIADLIRAHAAEYNPERITPA